METKFTKAGSSAAVIIPNVWLKMLNISSKDLRKYKFNMDIDTSNNKIILSGFQLNNTENTAPLTNDDIMTSDEVLKDAGLE